MDLKRWKIIGCEAKGFTKYTQQVQSVSEQKPRRVYGNDCQYPAPLTKVATIARV